MCWPGAATWSTCPVEVTAHALSLVGWDAGSHVALLDLDVSAGYYVRSLARDLGARLGVPAHLAALQRTGSGSWSIADAHSLAEVVQASPEAFLKLCEPMSAALGTWPALTLDDGQVQWVLAGRAVALTPGQTATLVDVPAERVRLLDEAGALVALAPLPTRFQPPRRHRPAVRASSSADWRKGH